MDATQIVTADLYDRFHADLQVCELQFRSFGAQAFCGPCETLSTFEDHTPVLAALEEPGAGRVLVVDAGGSFRVGVLGDRLAGIGVRNGWAGLVINGVIRDSAGIDAVGLGVKALGATARRGWTPGPGRRGAPVSFGAVTFHPGAWIYADRDAVLISPRALVV
ncbi:ribonuclease E activity regulator RraA [Thioclava sp. BHET1]|nr:ribonuclease E activity regulator RraA [Thioclava sp. BHET1]